MGSTSFSAKNRHRIRPSHFSQNANPLHIAVTCFSISIADAESLRFNTDLSSSHVSISASTHQYSSYMSKSCLALKYCNWSLKNLSTSIQNDISKPA